MLYLLATFNANNQNDMELNQVYIHEFSFTQEQVYQFAMVTGDENPAHTDPVFAAKTIFRKPVMHGMLGAAVLSKVFGTLFPGEGTIYISQNLNFLKPMYAGQIYEAVFTVKELYKNKHRAVIETLIRDKNGRICTSGEATIVNLQKIKPDV
jgi:acyl dehydratase